jgi:hypothetical protein
MAYERKTDKWLRCNRLRSHGQETSRRDALNEHRWVSEIRCVPSPSAPSDFEPPDRWKSEGVLKDQQIGKPSDRHSTFAVNVASETPGRAPVGEANGKDGVSAHSAQSASDVPTNGRGVRGKPVRWLTSAGALRRSSIARGRRNTARRMALGRATVSI